VHFIPLPLLSFYKNMGFEMRHYPVAYDTFSREITLPVFYDLTDEQIHTVCEAVAAAVAEVLTTTIA
jgi:dTDP-4-amino-4,6-dideoxygalactose transaminase